LALMIYGAKYDDDGDFVTLNEGIVTEDTSLSFFFCIYIH